MTDNKKLKGKQDRIRVAAKQKSEIAYLHSRYPLLTRRQIIAAVKSAGPMRRNIVKYLDKAVK